MMDWKWRFRVGLLTLLLSSNCAWAQKILDLGSVNERFPKTQSIDLLTLGVDSQKLKITVINQKPFSNYLTIDSIIDFPTQLIFQVKLEPYQNVYQNALVIVSSESRVVRYFKLKGQGTFSQSYYSSTRNLEGEALKLALKAKLASNYNSLGYSNARIEMFSKIDNWKVNGRGSSVDKIECVYTGRIITGYPFNTGTLVGPPWKFNTEHTYPQSLFSSNEPMRSDLHHLFPADVDENGRRGNSAFGTGSGKYEPRNEQKGRAARAMIYFATRYQDYQGFLAGQESVLRSWAKTYSPDSIDIRRNEEIYSVQRNRNPYVDYPQFLDRISSISGSAVNSHIKSMAFSPGLKSIVSDTIFQSWYFNELIYNDGTDTIFINKIALNQSGGKKQVMNSTLLGPNEVLGLSFVIGDSHGVDGGWIFTKDTLIIETDVPGKENQKIFYTGYVWTGSSINEHTNSIDFKIFPNPVSENIQLRLDGQNEYDYRVISTSGAVVQLGEVDNNQINVSSLVGGNYLLELTNQKGEKGLEKFMINQ